MKALSSSSWRPSTDAVVTGEAPATSAEDAIHDLALCEAIIRFVQDRRPITDPSAIPALTSAN